MTGIFNEPRSELVENLCLTASALHDALVLSEQARKAMHTEDGKDCKGCEVKHAADAAIADLRKQGVME